MKARCSHGRPWFGTCLDCIGESYQAVPEFLAALQAFVESTAPAGSPAPVMGSTLLVPSGRTHRWLVREVEVRC